jgi:4-hydroxybenzoyl-CoA thioesterase
VVVLNRPLKFEEIDAAGIAFFGCYATWAHDAMERFFDQLEGGYARLIVQRRLGLPAVHFETEFFLPLRYGDALRIETTVGKLGNRSAELRYRVMRASDGELAASMRHTVVCTDLATLRSAEMPADVREAFARHLAGGEG